MAETIVTENGDTIIVSVFESGVIINTNIPMVDGAEILRKVDGSTDLSIIEVGDTVGFYDYTNGKSRVEGIVEDVSNFKVYDESTDSYPNLKLYKNQKPQI